MNPERSSADKKMSAMGENFSIYSEVEVDAARDLVRELIRFIRSWRLYEGDHPTLGEMQIRLRQKWDNATAGGPLPLRLSDRRVFLEDEPLYRKAGFTVARDDKERPVLVKEL